MRRFALCTPVHVHINMQKHVLRVIGLEMLSANIAGLMYHKCMYVRLSPWRMVRNAQGLPL